VPERLLVGSLFCASSASTENNPATPIKALKFEAGGGERLQQQRLCFERKRSHRSQQVDRCIDPKVIFSVQDPENLPWIPNSNSKIHSQDGGTPQTKIFPPLQHRPIRLDSSNGASARLLHPTPSPK